MFVIKMLVSVLNDWRRLLLLKEERISSLSLSLISLFFLQRIYGSSRPRKGLELLLL